MDEEIEIVQEGASNWSMDEIMTSEIVYQSLSENYGQKAVDAVIEKLEIHKNDLGLGDNSKIILRILNGDL
jgi:hypothetical protein